LKRENREPQYGEARKSSHYRTNNEFYTLFQTKFEKGYVGFGGIIPPKKIIKNHSPRITQEWNKYGYFN